MKITVVGAGNIGLAIAAYLTQKKYDVTIFSSRIIKELNLYNADCNSIESVKNYKLSENPKVALGEADIILCTYPAFLRKKFIEKYGCELKNDCFLGFIPGYGGAEYFCMRLIKRGITIFGLQRVPYVARTQSCNYIYTAGILSKKKCIYAAAIPYKKTGEVVSIMEEILDIECLPLKEYLAITLAPSNPLLHITGLYGAFYNLTFNHPYTGCKGFYEEWNDETSRLLFEYDAELQAICNNLTSFNLQEVVSLPIYYEADTPEKMTKKLKSIKAFEAVKLPLKETENGLVPDLSSRMFVEDFPFGVCIIKDFAKMTNTQTPVVDKMLDFYYRISGIKYFNEDSSYTEAIKSTGVPGINSICNQNDLEAFYHI